MAIKFKCPACNEVRSANERLLGREINCPDCGNPVQLPTAEQVEAAKQAKLAAKRKRQAQIAQAVPAVAASPAATEVAPPLSAAERLAAEERELARESTSFSKPREKQEDEMDMTPMVDVTFLLLIFFMITASFSVQKVFQRPAQKSEEPSTQAVQQEDDENKDLVTVQVDEFNAFNVITSDWDKPAGSKQDLIVTLNDARSGDASGNQPTKLVVRAHVDCIHASVVAALDAGREANFSSFEVSTVEQFD